MNRWQTAPAGRGWVLAGASVILVLVALLVLARPRPRARPSHQPLNVQAVKPVPATLDSHLARKLLQVVVEIGIIGAVGLWATGRYWGAPAGIQLSGGETEWITSSAQWAALGLREYGRIPLWQPWLEFGEPLIDNPVGFVLNPISTLPSLVLGAGAGLRWSVALTTVAAGLATDRSKQAAQGYKIVHASPWVGDTGLSCLYHYPDALPYAYTVPLTRLLAARPVESGVLGNLVRTLSPDAVTPLTAFEREADVIALAVADSAPYHRVLTVQERAYPGWRVEINGQPARLESVGGQIGVLLPPDEGPFLVYFEFRPPLLILGGWITLLTALICIGWLLRVERIYIWIRAL